MGIFPFFLIIEPDIYRGSFFRENLPVPFRVDRLGKPFQDFFGKSFVFGSFAKFHFFCSQGNAFRQRAFRYLHGKYNPLFPIGLNVFKTDSRIRSLCLRFCLSPLCIRGLGIRCFYFVLVCPGYVRLRSFGLSIRLFCLLDCYLRHPGLRNLRLSNGSLRDLGLSNRSLGNLRLLRCSLSPCSFRYRCLRLGRFRHLGLRLRDGILRADGDGRTHDAAPRHRQSQQPGCHPFTN